MKNTEFIQKKKVGTAGLFQNQMMGNNATMPELGKYATELMYSDRHPYKVVKVSKDYKTVRLMRLDHEWDKTKQGGAGHQNWIFKETEYYSTLVWKWGAWRFMSDAIRFTKEFTSKHEAHYHHADVLTEEQIEEIWGKGFHPKKVVEGITEAYKEYRKASIIFQDYPNYHYDWEF